MDLSTALPRSRAEWILAATIFANTFGIGIRIACTTLYFTEIVKLSVDQVAAGLAVGGFAGLAASVPAGRISDRFGARRTQIAAMFAGAVATAAYLAADSFPAYLIVSVAVGLVASFDQTSRVPLIRRYAGRDQVRVRAYLRSVSNLGLALGSLAGGFAVALDSRGVYVGIFAARSVAYVACALLLVRLPRIEDTRGARRALPFWAVLRDRPFLSATALNAVISLHFAVPGFLLPLWIAQHTNAPRWTLSALLVLNTLMVAGLQVWASRGTDDNRAAGIRMRWAGFALGGGLLLMALSGGIERWFALGLLAVGMAVYTLGEMWQAAGSAQWCYGLAPAHAQGEYAGVFGLGAGLSGTLAPAVLTALPLTMGLPGWTLFAGAMLLVGVVSGPLLARSMPRFGPEVLEA